MTRRLIGLSLIIGAALVEPAAAQQRVAIPRSSLTTPGNSTTAPTLPAGSAPSPRGFNPWQTTPIVQTADNRNQVTAGAAPAGFAPNGSPPAVSAPAVLPTPPASTLSASPLPAAGGTQPIEPLKELRSGVRRHQAKVEQLNATLPNTAGQVWREYDIVPYTTRVTSTNRPEQAIIDWILRETGYEAWHSDPFGVLSANSKSVRVYHTPEMQAIVADVVDRFVSSEAEAQAYSLTVVTLANPNWRVSAQRFMQPIAVQSQGIQAWLMRREDAALVLSELRRRSDFREHSNPQMLINNGQAAAVNVTQSKPYIRNVILRQTATGPLYESDMGQFAEGFSLELNPLMAIDGRSVDAVVKCQIDQLERLVPVMLDSPLVAATRQRQKIEVPQAAHFRLHERFRWPADQVLVVGLGMVAPPTPQDPSPLLASLPIATAPPRADLLVIVESRGKIAPPSPATTLPTGVSPSAVAPIAPASANTSRFGGRY